MKKIYLVIFYFYIICLTSFTMPVEQSEANFRTFKNEKIMTLPTLVDTQLILTVIKDLQREFEDAAEDTIDEHQLDVIMSIVLICVEMYKKIIEATVTDYLMINIAGQPKLYDVIISITVSHSIKIINILYHEFIKFFFNHEITWNEKIIHCAWIIGLFFIIKVSIEKLPKNINSEHIFEAICEKNEEKVFWPKAKRDIF